MAAMKAFAQKWCRVFGRSVGRGREPASVADQEGLAPADGEQRDEKQAQVVIDSFETGLC
jgi:hypothetical protein